MRYATSSDFARTENKESYGLDEMPPIQAIQHALSRLNKLVPPSADDQWELVGDCGSCGEDHDPYNCPYIELTGGNLACISCGEPQETHNDAICTYGK